MGVVDAGVDDADDVVRLPVLMSHASVASISAPAIADAEVIWPN